MTKKKYTNPTERKPVLCDGIDYHNGCRTLIMEDVRSGRTYFGERNKKEYASHFNMVYFDGEGEFNLRKITVVSTQGNGHAITEKRDGMGHRIVLTTEELLLMAQTRLEEKMESCPSADIFQNIKYAALDISRALAHLDNHSAMINYPDNAIKKEKKNGK